MRTAEAKAQERVLLLVDGVPFRLAHPSGEDKGFIYLLCVFIFYVILFFPYTVTYKAIDYTRH